MKMIRTWQDLQRETLQLMRSYSLNGNPLYGTKVDSDNLDYIYAMPEAANYAMRDLATEASPLVRVLSLSLNPVPNMLGDGPTAFQTVQSLGQDIDFQIKDAKSFYFEFDRPASVTLQALGEDGQWNNLRDFPYPTDEKYKIHGFVAFKGNVESLDGQASTGIVRLHFAGGAAYNIRNVAFYAVAFDSADDVPPFTRYDRYDLRQMTAKRPGYEFMRLAPNNAVQYSGATYRRSDDFRWEGDSTMVFDHYAQGQWDIYYYAYPTPIVGALTDELNQENPNPDATPLDFPLELAPEALDIVPLYMASRLYTEEKPDLCSLYLNQYMARRAELADRQNATGITEFVSESGWV